MMVDASMNLGRVLVCCGLALLLAGAAFAQSPAPAFEIADVHASAPRPNPYMIPHFLEGDRYTVRNATVADLVMTAYGVDISNVIGGPGWIDTDRFDVIAKAPPSTAPQVQMLMLQALLADRFKLKIHHSTKALSGYVLKLGTGPPQLRVADGSGDSRCRTGDGVPSNLTYSCRNMTMSGFAKALPEIGSRYYLGSASDPVLDLTGLKGAWDFEVKLTNNNFRLPVLGADGITIFDAVEKLGLKLEMQRFPKPVIVVDRVRKPIGNPPGVAQSLVASLLSKFVVEIKPAGVPPTAGAPRPPGAQYGATLRNLIDLAWGRAGRDPPLEGAPPWLDSERFDVFRKASAGALPISTMGTESSQVVFRAILTERFHLATHEELRPRTVYALVAEPHRMKLKKADRSSRSVCRPAAEVTRDVALTISFACTNTTMAQFAERMRSIGLMYLVNRPTVDATGLKGSWDFTIAYTGTQALSGVTNARPRRTIA